ncbi:SPFH domain-containing protein [Niallia circulans]
MGVLLIAISLFLGVYFLVQEIPGAAIPFFLIAVLLGSGITIIQPNQAVVVTFFGKYLGTIRSSGLFLTIPLTLRKTISLRVRNFNSKRLKVNDVDGNPIEIAAVIVFKVIDSAKAIFDVDNYEEFVEIQSETAIRHVATKYPYDTFENVELTLRGNAEEVSNELTTELQARLDLAGVEVIEARLTHLAYSTEIAQAMLQRQQASAIISARQKIVEGAVGMAQMAINQLEQDKIIELDDERKVQLVNNLLVAIVSENPTTPVINTGTLY